MEQIVLATFVSRKIFVEKSGDSKKSFWLVLKDTLFRQFGQHINCQTVIQTIRDILNLPKPYLAEHNPL
jgi:hypothetical protein